jgi:hypothetical protein
MAKTPISIVQVAAHPETFRRTLSEDHAEIVSRCEICGEVLTGTVRNGLPKREVQHFISCSEADRKASAKTA